MATKPVDAYLSASRRAPGVAAALALIIALGAPHVAIAGPAGAPAFNPEPTFVTNPVPAPAASPAPGPTPAPAPPTVPPQPGAPYGGPYGGGPYGGPYGGHRQYPDGGYGEGYGNQPTFLGSAAMSPNSDYPLAPVSANIVGLVGSTPFPGVATVMVSGTICADHVSGTSDNASLRILMDGYPSADPASYFTIPAAQSDGTICSSFSMTATFAPFTPQAHSIWLTGQATGGYTRVSGAALSVMVYQ